MKTLTVIGLMSGTSIDGIDAAIIKTDGNKIYDIGYGITIEYTNQFREKLKTAMSCFDNILEVERELTLLHASAVDQIIKKANLNNSDIDLIGFHGQTIIHRPKSNLTWQIGNAALLAEMTGIDVIADFRRRDIAAGGEGAPLIPIFHKELCSEMKKPIAIVNIGGVSNITWIDDDRLIAFDAGPGSAMIDDFVYNNFGKKYDHNGDIARSGKVNEEILSQLKSSKYFDIKPPKSLDRNDFNINYGDIDKKDIVASLTMFTAHSIRESVKHLPIMPKQWLITGGGRKNIYMMEILNKLLSNNVKSIDHISDGDMIEAYGFAYLAARCYYGYNISYPSTTGVDRPLSGGAFYRA